MSPTFFLTLTGNVLLDAGAAALTFKVSTWHSVAMFRLSVSISPLMTTTPRIPFGLQVYENGTLVGDVGRHGNTPRIPLPGRVYQLQRNDVQFNDSE